MTMRSTVFKPGAFTLDGELHPEKYEFEKLIKQETAAGDLVLENHDGTVTGFLGAGSLAINNMSPCQKNRKVNNSSKVRIPHIWAETKTQIACTAVASGPEENWNNLGVPSSPSKQMNSDSNFSINKTQTLLGQTEIMGRFGSQVTVSNAKDFVEGDSDTVVDSSTLELSMENKWKNVKRNPSHSPSQTACLKQLLLLQLDLIEQQQQQLQAKEKEIDELKAEKETLLARLERMERRLQLVKKDSERDRYRIFQSPEVEEKKMTEPHEKLFIEHQEATVESPPAGTPKTFSHGKAMKGHKRKSAFGCVEKKTPVKKLVTEFSKLRTKPPKHSVPKEPCRPVSETTCKRELRSKETPEICVSQMDTPVKADAFQKGPAEHIKDKDCPSETLDLPYLSTTDMYLCRWHKPPPSPLRELSPRKEETVAIPSWRAHPIEPLEDLSTLEVVENLDDSVFAKRHAKLELDEKRRKRWDIQRIREQRILQRLQLRMYKKKGIQESEPDITSFFPDPDDDILFLKDNSSALLLSCTSR
ncbi:male-specific lethal 1 homolog isoform X2 [Protopterus annectens]|uniref:male-specific lethal 1 homolog isoform X2 n=1 Tax=Protopterus annectens TaxID=7888 RepID=UPI001CFA7C32|nr:male-specific lethal 1 homolog isoform X2 [Protopterus annectens]